MDGWMDGITKQMVVLINGTPFYLDHEWHSFGTKVKDL